VDEAAKKKAAKGWHWVFNKKQNKWVWKKKTKKKAKKDSTKSAETLMSSVLPTSDPMPQLPTINSGAAKDLRKPPLQMPPRRQPSPPLAARTAFYLKKNGKRAYSNPHHSR